MLATRTNLKEVYSYNINSLVDPYVSCDEVERKEKLYQYLLSLNKDLHCLLSSCEFLFPSINNIGGQVIDINIWRNEEYSFFSFKDIKREIFYFNFLNLILPQERTLEEKENEMFAKITDSFSEIPEVRSVYKQKYRSEMQIFILLSIDKYDYTLMKKLLNIEYDIRKKYKEILFEFFYPYVGVSRNREDFIHPKAICIYSRTI